MWHGTYATDAPFLPHLSAFKVSQILIPSEFCVLTLVYLLVLHVCRQLL
jgi:hypothetical protein